MMPQYGEDQLIDHHLKLVHAFSPNIRLLQGECGAPSKVRVCPAWIERLDHCFDG
jgi:hypothetical protein